MCARREAPPRKRLDMSMRGQRGKSAHDIHHSILRATLASDSSGSHRIRDRTHPIPPAQTARLQSWASPLQSKRVQSKTDRRLDSNGQTESADLEHMRSTLEGAASQLNTDGGHDGLGYSSCAAPGIRLLLHSAGLRIPEDRAILQQVRVHDGRIKSRAAVITASEDKRAARSTILTSPVLATHVALGEAEQLLHREVATAEAQNLQPAITRAAVTAASNSKTRTVTRYIAAPTPVQAALALHLLHRILTSEGSEHLLSADAHSRMPSESAAKASPKYMQQEQVGQQKAVNDRLTVVSDNPNFPNPGRDQDLVGPNSHLGVTFAGHDDGPRQPGDSIQRDDFVIHELRPRHGSSEPKGRFPPSASRAAALRCLRVIERCMFLPPSVVLPGEPSRYYKDASDKGVGISAHGGHAARGDWTSACHDPEALYGDRRTFMEAWAGATRSKEALREKVVSLERELHRLKKKHRTSMGRKIRSIFRLAAQQSMLQKRRQDTMTRAMLAPTSKLRQQFAAMGVMQQQQTLGALMRALRGGVRAVPVLKLMLALPRSQRVYLFHGIGCWLRVGDKALQAALRADFDSSREMKARSRLLDEAKAAARRDTKRAESGAGDDEGDSARSDKTVNAAEASTDSSGESALREKEEIALLNIEYLMQLAQGTGSGRLDRIKQEASTGASGMADAALGLRQLVAAKYRPAAADAEPSRGGNLRRYMQQQHRGSAATETARLKNAADQQLTPASAPEAFDLTAGSVSKPSIGVGLGAASAYVSNEMTSRGSVRGKNGRRGSIDVLSVLRAGTSTGDNIRKKVAAGTPFVLRGLMLLDAAEPLLDEARAVSGDMALRVKLADVLEEDDTSRLAWAKVQLAEHRDFLQAMELSRMAGSYNRKQIRGQLRMHPPTSTKDEIRQVLSSAGQTISVSSGSRQTRGIAVGYSKKDARARVELDAADDQLAGALDARARALLQVKERLRAIEGKLRDSDQRKQKRLLGDVSSDDGDGRILVERRDYLSDESIVRDVIKVCADASSLRSDLQSERERRRGLERRVLALGIRLAAVRSTTDTQTRVAREQGLLDVASFHRGQHLLVDSSSGSPGFVDGPGFGGILLALHRRAESWGMSGSSSLQGVGINQGAIRKRQRVELKQMLLLPDQAQKRAQAVVREWLRAFRALNRRGPDESWTHMVRLVAGASGFQHTSQSRRLAALGSGGFTLQHLARSACSLPTVRVQPKYPLSTRHSDAPGDRSFTYSNKSPRSSAGSPSAGIATPRNIDVLPAPLEIDSMQGTAAASIDWTSHREGEQIQASESMRAAAAGIRGLHVSIGRMTELVAEAEASISAGLSSQAPRRSVTSVQAGPQIQLPGGTHSEPSSSSTKNTPSVRIGRRRLHSSEASPLLQRLRQKRADLSGQRELADSMIEYSLGDENSGTPTNLLFGAKFTSRGKGGGLARLAIKHGASEDPASAASASVSDSDAVRAAGPAPSLHSAAQKLDSKSSKKIVLLAGVPPCFGSTPSTQQSLSSLGNKLRECMGKPPQRSGAHTSIDATESGWLSLPVCALLIDPSAMLDIVRRGAVARAVDQGRVHQSQARSLTQSGTISERLSGGVRATGASHGRHSLDLSGHSLTATPATSARRGSIVRSILKHHELQAERSAASDQRLGSTQEGGKAAVAAHIGRRGSLSLLPEIDRVAGTALEELLAVVPRLEQLEATVYRRSATAASLRRLDRVVAWQAAKRSQARARLDAVGGEALVPAGVTDVIADILRRSAFQASQDGIDALTALDAAALDKRSDTLARDSSLAAARKRTGGGERQGGNDVPSSPRSRSAAADLRARAKQRTSQILDGIRVSRERVHPTTAGMAMGRMILQAYLEMPFDAIVHERCAHLSSGSVHDMTSPFNATQANARVEGKLEIEPTREIPRADGLPPAFLAVPGSLTLETRDQEQLKAVILSALQTCVPDTPLSDGAHKRRGVPKKKRRGNKAVGVVLASRDTFLLPQLNRAMEVATIFATESSAEAMQAIRWIGTHCILRLKKSPVLAVPSWDPEVIQHLLAQATLRLERTDGASQGQYSTLDSSVSIDPVRYSLAVNGDLSEAPVDVAGTGVRGLTSRPPYALTAQTVSLSSSFGAQASNNGKKHREAQNLLTLLEAQSISLSLVSWVLDQGGIERLIEALSASLYSAGCRNQTRGHGQSIIEAEAGQPHGQNDWVPTHHASIGRFLLRFYLAQDTQSRLVAEAAQLQRENRPAARPRAVQGTTDDVDRSKVEDGGAISPRAQLQSITKAARRSSAGAMSTDPGHEKALNPIEDEPDVRTPQGRAALARNLFHIDAGIEQQALAFEAAIVAHSPMASRCRCLGQLLGLTDSPLIGVAPDVRSAYSGRRLETCSASARRSLLMATQQLTWPHPLDHDPAVFNRQSILGTKRDGGNEEVDEAASSIAMDTLRAASDWRGMFLDAHASSSDAGGTDKTGTTPCRSMANLVDTSRFQGSGLGEQVALWERYCCLLALSVDTALDREHGAVTSEVLSSSAARFYLGRRVGLDCKDQFDACPSNIQLLGGLKSDSKQRTLGFRLSGGDKPGQKASSFEHMAETRVVTIAGAPAGGLIPAEDSVTSRGSSVVRPGAKPLWPADTLAVPSAVQLSHQYAVLFQDSMEQQLLGQLTSIADDSANSQGMEEVSISRLPQDKAASSGTSKPGVNFMGPIVRALKALYRVQDTHDQPDAREDDTGARVRSGLGLEAVDLGSTLAPLFPGSPLSSGVVQLQSGWTLLTADRVRYLCYRSLSQGLSQQETDRMQGGILRRLVEATMTGRKSEAEYEEGSRRVATEARAGSIRDGGTTTTTTTTTTTSTSAATRTSGSRGSGGTQSGRSNGNGSVGELHAQRPAGSLLSVPAPVALDAEAAWDSERLSAIDHIVARIETHLHVGHAGLFSVDDAVELAFSVSQAFWVLHPVGGHSSEHSDDV